MVYDKAFNSKFRIHALLPNYTTEDIKDKGTSVIFKSSNASISQAKNEKSSNTPYSTFHPTLLTNFQLSTNSCVNIKGAEVEQILQSSNNDIFHTKTDKEKGFADYSHTMISPTVQSDRNTNTQRPTTRDTTNRHFSILNQHATPEVPQPSFLYCVPKNKSEKSSFSVKVLLLIIYVNWLHTILYNIRFGSFL